MNIYKSKMAKFYMLLFLICFSNEVLAAKYSDAFKEFILGVDQQGGMEALKPVAKLPDMSRSITCMECHDGSQARGVSLKHSETPMKFTGHGSVNHPVGMKYDYYAKNNPVVFVSLERLDKRIILEDGEVTCISCHALKNTLSDESDNFIKTSVFPREEYATSYCTANNKKLTTESNITTLCLSCHAM